MGAPDPAFSGRVPPSCSPIYRLRNLSPPPAAQVPLLLKSAVRPPRCRTHSALNPEPVRISGEDSVFLPAVFALTADGGVRRPAAYSPSFRRGKGPAGSTSPFAALRKSGLSRTFASTGSPAGCAHSSGFIVGNRKPVLCIPPQVPISSALPGSWAIMFLYCFIIFNRHFLNWCKIRCKLTYPDLPLKINEAGHFSFLRSFIVNIHCCRDIRMPHDFLNNLEIFLVLAKTSAKCMP